jgi:nucleotide-binding universal stress UspA family protein
MYRTIFVPLDGSPFAEQALPLALGLARRAEAVLHVAHVHVPVAPLYAGNELAADAPLDFQVWEQEYVYVQEVVKRLKAVARLRVTSTVLDGPIAESLAEQAVAADADLLVMTTHGRGPLSRFWLGSVADKLVRLAPMPLLLLRPPEGPPDLSQEPLPRRILIPLDGSELAEQVLEPALALGRLAQADYTLLGVIESASVPEYAIAGHLLEEREDVAILPQQAKVQAYLDRVADRLRGRSLHVQTRVIRNQPPAVAILKEAHRHPGGLIALATHGRRGLKRMLLGSIADKVIRGATPPVLVYRPPNP